MTVLALDQINMPGEMFAKVGQIFALVVAVGALERTTRQTLEVWFQVRVEQLLMVLRAGATAAHLLTPAAEPDLLRSFLRLDEVDWNVSVMLSHVD